MFTPGGTNQFEHFNFAESLRNGPLSPNLLSGPQGPLPFDPSTFRTGLTPNESSIRTGLTPGTAPAFPMLPTPTTAALLGPYTPNTTAALASIQSSTYPVSFPPRPDPFGESQAANGLVFLAQTSQQQAQQNVGSNPPAREDLGRRGSGNNSKINPYQDPSTLMNNQLTPVNKKEDPPKNTRTKRVKEEATVNGKEATTASRKSKSKSVETDDEKRRNFLERNRQGTYGPLYYTDISRFKMSSTKETMAHQSPTKSRLVHT